MAQHFCNDAVYARSYEPPEKMVEHEHLTQLACDNCSLHATQKCRLFVFLHLDHWSSLCLSLSTPLPFSRVYTHTYTHETCGFFRDLLLRHCCWIQLDLFISCSPVEAVDSNSWYREAGCSPFGSVERVHGFVFNRQLNLWRIRSRSYPNREKVARPGG